MSRSEAGATTISAASYGSALPIAASSSQEQAIPEVERFLAQSQRRKVDSSVVAAKRTAELLRAVVSRSRLGADRRGSVSSNSDSQLPEHADALVAEIRRVGRQLTRSSRLHDLSVANVVRRVLRIIRDEAAVIARTDSEALDDEVSSGDVGGGGILHSSSTQSLTSLTEAEVTVRKPQSSKEAASVLKHGVIEAIMELVQEFDSISKQIADQAVEHIRTNDTVLTIGRSKTVGAFLTGAKRKKRSFHVIVSEGAPRFDGHAFARDLAADAGILTTLIPDGAVFAVMPKVDIVLIGAHAVMANGGIIAPLGSHTLALAAQKHGVSVAVLAGLHKLSPVFAHAPSASIGEHRAPAEVLGLEEVADYVADPNTGALSVVNPTVDYVPPHLISLLITDSGGHSPSYVYRLLAEYYNMEDYELS